MVRRLWCVPFGGHCGFRPLLSAFPFCIQSPPSHFYVRLGKVSLRAKGLRAAVAQTFAATVGGWFDVLWIVTASLLALTTL